MIIMTVCLNHRIKAGWKIASHRNCKGIRLTWFASRAFFINMFLLVVWLVMYANNWVLHGPKVVSVCLHITLISSFWCRLAWKHWTCKMLVRYIMSSICQRSRLLSLLSIMLYAIYGVVFFQLIFFSFGDYENICTSYFIIIKLENINH